MIKKVVSMALGLLALLTGLLATTSLHAYPQGGSITAPTLTSVSPNYGSLAGGTTVTLAGTNFSTSTGGTTASFGATAATSVSCSTTTSCTVTTPPGPTGGGNVPVTLTTAAGTSSQTVYFDYTVSSAPPPTITSISPTAGPESGETTVTLTGTGFSTTQSPQVLGTVVYFGSAGPAMSVSCSSTTSCTATSPFYSGNYTGNNITVSLTVATAGGVSNGVNFTYILPPSVNSISPAFGPQTGGQSVTLTGANFNTTGGTTVDFGPNNPATSVSCPSTTSCTVTSPPGPTGGGNVLLTATTTVGGTSSQTVYFDYTVSSAPPPTITSISPTFGPIYGGTTVTLTGTGFSTTQSPQVLGTVVYFGSGSPAPSVSCSSTTSCTAVTPFFYSGAITGNNVTVSLTAVTAGGTSNGVNFIYIPPPTITSISPTSGPQIGGTTVTLTGTGFSTTGGGTTVDFGPNNPATSVSCPSTTSCTVTSPPGPTGGGNVLLTATTTGGGSSVGTVYFDYTVSSAPPPTITSISPTFGPTFAATTVTLTGTGFSTTKSSGVLGTAVYFGSTPAPSVSCSSTTSCTAITPFFYGGNYTSNITVSLTAVTAGGTSNGVNFTYIPPPTITSISSISGPQAGGTTLTLTGTGFSTASGATTVDFGSTPATSVSCTSTTSCTVTSPSGPTGGGNVLLTVTTAGGTSLETVYFDYTVLSAPPPTIASISPNSSPIDGSITVTLSGTGFSTASSSQVLGTVVYFGSTAATSVSCLSTTSCTAVAPGYNGVIYNGKSITASVTIATAGGVSNGVNFTYILPPSVNSISPAFGPQTGGTTVTLTGTGFSTATGATTVSFGSTPATGVSCSSTTSCTATSPTGPNGGGNVPLTVTTTSGGTSFVTVYFDYTVSSAPPPTITSISPNSGASGITIMLNGTGFSTTSSSQVLGTVVYFGSAGPAVLSSCSTTSSCTAIAPFYGGSNTTVSVTVTTAGGTSNSVSFTYIAPTGYTPVAPYRICDTRASNATSIKQNQCDKTGASPIGPNSAIQVQVSGYNSPYLPSGETPVPTTATAVVLNVTAIGGTSPSYLSVCPGKETSSTCSASSNLNFSSGTSIPNLVQVGLSSAGSIEIYNFAGSVNVAVDVEGYVGSVSSSGQGAFNSLSSPYRVCDTRVSNGTTIKQNQCDKSGASPIGPNSAIQVQVSGYNSPYLPSGETPVPTGASAVVLNVTAIGGTSPSYLSVCPGKETSSTCSASSNLNFSSGEDISNSVVAELNSSGFIEIYNFAGSVNVAVDISGWFSGPGGTGSTFQSAANPYRVCDTRVSNGTTIKQNQCDKSGASPIGPKSAIQVQVSGYNSPYLPSGETPVPTTATAVVLNVTAIGGTSPSYLSVCPGKESASTCSASSNLNFIAGEDIPNFVTVGLSSTGSIEVYNFAGSVNVAVDVVGWYG